MNEQEVRRLLAVLMGYDNRKPGTTNILVWMEQARRNGWTYPEAEEAVHRYHETAEQRPFMMPGHVSDLIRQQRAENGRQQRRAIADAQMKELEPPSDAIPDPERVGELMGQMAEMFGWMRKNVARQAPELAVVCPHCDAGPGRPCARKVHRGVARGQFKPIAGFHESRSQAAGTRPIDGAA